MPRVTNATKWKTLVQSDDTNPTETGVSNWKTVEILLVLDSNGVKTVIRDTMFSDLLVTTGSLVV